VAEQAELMSPRLQSFGAFAIVPSNDLAAAIPFLGMVRILSRRAATRNTSS
jgi:hypothetical protein